MRRKECEKVGVNKTRAGMSMSTYLLVGQDFFYGGHEASAIAVAQHRLQGAQTIPTMIVRVGGKSRGGDEGAQTIPRMIVRVRGKSRGKSRRSDMRGRVCVIVVRGKSRRRDMRE